MTPALQVQLLTTTAAGAEAELSGQAAQDESILPTPILNVLNGQLAQACKTLSPLVILSLISAISMLSRTASTMYKPAIRPWKYGSSAQLLLPTSVFLTILSFRTESHSAVRTTLLIVMVSFRVSCTYCVTMVCHEFSTKSSDEKTLQALASGFRMVNTILLPGLTLYNITLSKLLMPSKLRICSLNPAGFMAVNFNRTITVNPPLLAMFRVRDPLSK